MEFKNESLGVTVNLSNYIEGTTDTICVAFNSALPKYYHLRPDGTLYSYHLPDYYAWGKRKANKK